MTRRFRLILGLLIAVPLGGPVTIFSKQSAGAAPRPPAPPVPPAGAQASPEGTATIAEPAAAVRTASSSVPAVRFMNENDSPVGEQAQRDSDGPAIPAASISVVPPHSDPLVELTARMVEDADVVRSDNDDLVPADIQTCDQCCCPPCRPVIWVGGVEATFLWAEANSDDSTFEFFDEQRDMDVAFSSASDGIDSMYLTPRIWLGVQGCEWGTNVRYWHLRAGGGTFDPALDNDSDGWSHSNFNWNATPDTGYFSDSQLDAYTVDWELNRRFCVQNCAMQASLGVRYGSVQLSDSITGLAIDDDARHVGFARSDSYSRGTGIVLGLYGRKALFPCSCVHWFYNARLSSMWGPTTTSAETFAAVMVDGSNAGSVNGASTHVDDTLFVGEIQLGLEWDYALQCLPANAFFRTAIEYQRWDGGGGSSEAGSFASFTGTNNFTSTAEVFTSAASPQLDLLGLTIGTGLTW